MTKYLYRLVIPILLAACTQPTEQEDQSEVSSSMQVKDSHTFAQPQKAVMTHLNWEAVVSFEKKQIDAVARITVEAAEGADQLILDTRNLAIDRVTLGEQEAATEFTLGEEVNHLGKALKIALSPNTTLVNVYYHTTKGAEALQWLNPEQTGGKKHPFLFTQSQAILARTWVPVQDSPGIRFTYEATVKVPAELLALMSAENPQQRNAEGVYQFKMEQPIPAYLLALSVGDLAFKPIGEKTGVYAEPAQLEAAAYEFAELDEMLEAAEKLYGNYRWDRYDLLVLPPSFPFGGMENPRLTFVTPTILAGDRSLTSLVAHELAHSWSGNLVTNATWDDFWLNEGFTVYFERRIMEEIAGTGYAEMLAQLGEQDLQHTLADLTNDGQAKDTHLKLSLENRNPDDGMTDIAYEKGYSFLRYLEEKVGRQAFDTFLKNYFSTYAFKSMTTEAFIDYLQAELLEPNALTKEDIYLKEWIYEAGLPKVAIKAESDRFTKVENAMAKWQAGTSAQKLNTSNWSSHEWLHFIRLLPDNVTTEQMQELDSAFGFTQSGNSEILAAWFEHVIAKAYEPAYPSLEKFLINVGRRKFLVPLYRKMVRTESGRQRALAIYQQARPNYHSVSTNTLDELLGYDKG